MTSAALLVLNPRHIPDCIQAIRALNLPTCWISYMPEDNAANAINQAIEDTDYDRYLILSDDTIPTPRSVRLILEQADQHPVVTGYCNLDEGQYADIVNLTTNVLPPPPSRTSSYQFLTRTQVEHHPNPAVPTTFAGLALTLLPRDIAQAFPLQVDPTTGGQMDYDLSHRLAQAGIPIVAARGAYIRHVKERWSHMDQNPQKRLLIGHRHPAVTWTTAPITAGRGGQ